MRQGYEKYSDGNWRRVYKFLNGKVMMIVRDDKARWITTVRGKKQITIALARVKKLNSSDARKENFAVRQEDELARWRDEGSAASKRPRD